MVEGIKFIIEAVDKFSGTIDSAKKEISSLGGFIDQHRLAIAAAAAAMTAVGLKTLSTLSDWTREAARAGDVQAAFNKLVGDKGVNALANLNKETLKTISKLEQMRIINSAITKGLQIDLIPTYAKFSQQLLDAGIATGNVSNVMNELTTAMNTGRTAALKQYGIMIDGSQVYNDYAKQLGTTADNLSELQKREALQLEITKQIVEASAKLPEPMRDFDDAIKNIQATFADFKVAIGTSLLPAFESIANGLQIVLNWFNKLNENQQMYITISAVVAGAVLTLTGLLLGLAVACTILDIAMWPVVVCILAVIAIISSAIYIFLNWSTVMQGIVFVVMSITSRILLAIFDFKSTWAILWAAISNFFTKTWNGIVDGLQSLANFGISAINALINAYNRLPKKLRGGTIALITPIDLGQWKKELNDIAALAEQQVKDREALQKSLEKAKWEKIRALRAESDATKTEIDNQKVLSNTISKTTEEEKKLADMMEKVNRLQGYKSQYSINPSTGETTYGDIYNPKGFSSSDFQSQFAYEQAKLGAGTTITIQNVYGMDPDELSNALMEQLRKKLSI